MLEVVNCGIFPCLSYWHSHTHTLTDKHGDQMAFSVVSLWMTAGHRQHTRTHTPGPFQYRYTPRTHDHTDNISLSVQLLKQTRRHGTTQTETHTHTQTRQTLGTDSIEGPEMRHDGTWQSDMECFFGHWSLIVKFSGGFSRWCPPERERRGTRGGRRSSLTRMRFHVSLKGKHQRNHVT